MASTYMWMPKIRRNAIYNMECLNGMSFIKDASIPLILTDLPYGTTQNRWDSPIDLQALWSQYRRILQPGGVVVLTAQCPFDKVLGVSNLEWLKYELIWEKNIATGFLNAKKAPLKSHENILIFAAPGSHTYNPQMSIGTPYKRKRKPTASKNYGNCKVETVTESDLRYPQTIISFAHDERENSGKLHPTQKPVALFEYLIQTYSNTGDTVLDSCIGSGTTAIAALNTDRKYIGFELDPEFCTVARKRVKDHKIVRKAQTASLEHLFE